MGGEITLTMNNTPLSPIAAVEPLTKAVRFRQVSILKRKKTGAVELKKARDLYKTLFAGLAVALRELDAIQSSTRPYGLISKVEALLATAETANEALAAERRDHALEMIDQKIATVVADLEQIQASSELRNQALHSLQMLRQKVTAESSIPQIYYLQGQASNLLDKALDMVADYQAKQAHKPEPLPPAAKDSATGINDLATKNVAAANKPAAAQVTIKPTKTVKAANLTAGKQFLENETEVENYIARLRDELLVVVRTGNRARIE